MLAFVGLPGLDHDTRYQLVSHTATEVVYRAVQGGTLEVTLGAGAEDPAFLAGPVRKVADVDVVRAEIVEAARP